jgi:hypothetical protein
LTFDVDYHAVEPGCTVDNLLTGVAARHHHGSIVSFADGHAAWVSLKRASDKGFGDPQFVGDLDLVAACPVIYDAEGPYSATCNVASYLQQSGTVGEWPRFQVALPPMTEGYKQGGRMPNFCLEYDIVTSHGVQESPAINIGIMKPEHITMADNNSDGVDFLSGITLACMTHDADDSLNDRTAGGAGIWFHDGTWQPCAETHFIPRPGFGRFFTNVHLRGVIVRLHGAAYLLGDTSGYQYTVLLDQSGKPGGWGSIPDGQRGVYFYGWCSPDEDNSVTVANVIVRAIPAWAPLPSRPTI